MSFPPKTLFLIIEKWENNNCRHLKCNCKCIIYVKLRDIGVVLGYVSFPPKTLFLIIEKWGNNNCRHLKCNCKCIIYVKLRDIAVVLCVVSSKNFVSHNRKMGNNNCRHLKCNCKCIIYVELKRYSSSFMCRFFFPNNLFLIEKLEKNNSCDCKGDQSC